MENEAQREKTEAQREKKWLAWKVMLVKAAELVLNH